MKLSLSRLGLSTLFVSELTGAAVLPRPEHLVTCRNPPVRKEWRSLSTFQKKDYIDSVLCLQHQPAITKSQFCDNPWLKPINRYDDFQAVHHNQTPFIHFVGHFSLWHRYMIAEYESTLREVCGYEGAQPYWDWSIDASSTNNLSTTIYETDIFSPTEGFGGNGPYVATQAQDPLNFTGLFNRTGGGCVRDGPFTQPHFSVNVNQTSGPGTCLKRDFTPAVMNWGSAKNVQDVLSRPDYTSFAYALEGIPSFSQQNIHASGHFGVGGLLGQAGDMFNSPGEPLFYMHHANMDRVLWLWQQRDLKRRLKEVGGPVKPRDYGGVNVTLEFEVDLGAIAGSVSLRDLLDTEGGNLCYTYDG